MFCPIFILDFKQIIFTALFDCLNCNCNYTCVQLSKQSYAERSEQVAESIMCVFVVNGFSTLDDCEMVHSTNFWTDKFVIKSKPRKTCFFVRIKITNTFLIDHRTCHTSIDFSLIMAFLLDYLVSLSAHFGFFYYSKHHCKFSG